MSPMKTILTLAGLFFTLTLASPTGPIATSLSTNQTSVNATNPWTFTIDAANGPQDKCGESTFASWNDDDIAFPSPLASDCRVINKNIAGGGRWEVESVVHKQHQIAQFGTCAFVVKAWEPYKDSFFYVGNTDIIDIINTALNRYEKEDGTVRATGQMHCQAAALGANVRWQIIFNR